MDELIGTIKFFAGTFVPKGFMECNGALLSIASNTTLYSILGTTYGGDGRQTFALPDLRSRVAIGMGQGQGLSDYNLGQKEGDEFNILTLNNLPNHTHTATLNVNSANATMTTPIASSSIAAPGITSGREFTPGLGFNSSSPSVAMNPASIQLAAVGGSTPVNNIQPSLALKYIICVDGLYPSRQ
ncbi:tail fiber protein [Flavobacterium sp. NG2]|uniref:phage tail protein n=1 Tax=Flavobacterium sp. NG2 TaxID=3097547 RepID=UPI002A82C325|nr:tail fiber protein [Flavobacterium sp. NG2]WPR72943.1 tail fiber protein [Flavobacterium sp. NG2]